MTISCSNIRTNHLEARVDRIQNLKNSRIYQILILPRRQKNVACRMSSADADDYDRLQLQCCCYNNHMEMLVIRTPSIRMMQREKRRFPRCKTDQENRNLWQELVISGGWALSPWPLSRVDRAFTLQRQQLWLQTAMFASFKELSVATWKKGKCRLRVATGSVLVYIFF